MLVIDASVLVKLVVEEANTSIAQERVTAEADCIAPTLILTEIASALAKKVRFADLSKELAARAFDSAPRFLMELVETDMLLREAMILSAALDHSLFDCIYLALALDRDCAVLTADAKFAKRASAAGYAANVVTLR